MSTRFVVVYTSNYAIKPFKVVYDSRYTAYTSRYGSEMECALTYREKPAEDSNTQLFTVESNVSNEELLKVLNGTMELWIPSGSFK